ncbi:MAG TPA: lactate racemase domain-containing protein [Spirochaetia bacterium]|nr:lactate racemase domain-containing protein [Spirochaetia bacterium]
MATGTGSPSARLSEADIRTIVEEGIPASLVEGRRVLVLTPDPTRTCPLSLMARVVRDIVGRRASGMDFMVALGTHTILSEERIDALFGVPAGRREEVFPGIRFFNHRWDLPSTLRKIGTIPAEKIDSLSGGLFHESVDVIINSAVFEYDLILILGPVFPHEVIGFSGGNKYFFPGISGGEFLHFFHWLGAVITCPEVIGYKNTPVRALVDMAACLFPTPRACLAMVVRPDGALAGLYAGTPEEAWSLAADLSAQIHIIYKEAPFHTVLGRAPEMYDELWTAGKVMYKLEPVVAPGGSLTIYAPHVRDISRTWGRYLERTGYHVRDWFLGRMEQFRDIPRGVLAHSTHVRGIGTFADGVEKPRIDVVLATGISEDTCRKINLGYRDPSTVRVEDYRGKEDEGVLFVDHAGEILHRLARDRAAGGA